MAIFAKRQFWIAFLMFFLVFSTGWTVFSYRSQLDKTSSNYQQKAFRQANSIAQKLNQRTRHWMELSRFLTEAAIEEDWKKTGQLAFLKRQLARNEAILGITIYKRELKVADAEDGPKAKVIWKPDFYITREKDDPARLGSEDIGFLDDNVTLPFARVENGKSGVVSAPLQRGGFVFRLVIPYGKQNLSDGTLFHNALVIETHPAEFFPELKDSGEVFTYITNHEGLLLAQNKTQHFHSGEDLSHLPIVREAKTTEEMAGTAQFRELPEAPLQNGSFVKTKIGGLIIVSQFPEKAIYATLAEITKVSILFGLGLSLLGVFIAFSLYDLWNRNPKRKKKKVVRKVKKTNDPEAEPQINKAA